MFSIESGLGFVISGIVFQKFGFRSFLSHFVHPTLVHPTSLGRATQIPFKNYKIKFKKGTAIQNRQRELLLILNKFPLSKFIFEIEMQV